MTIKTTRVSSGKVDSQVKNSQLIGGSADLSSSTKIAGADGDFNNKTIVLKKY